MIGCIHNIQRYFVYPREIKSGSTLVIRCPEGCADINVGIHDHDQKRAPVKVAGNSK